MTHVYPTVRLDGTIGDVITSMGVFPANADVMDWGCRAIMDTAMVDGTHLQNTSQIVFTFMPHVCYGIDVHRAKVDELGGVESVLQAMMNHPQAANVQEAAINCIAYLVLHGIWPVALM